MCFEENPIILPAPVSLYKWVVKKKLNAEITFVDMTATKNLTKTRRRKCKIWNSPRNKEEIIFFL